MSGAFSAAGRKPVGYGTPVISIGNLSTGGTGKTPFTIALAQLLKRQGFAVDVLSRGYGRRREFSGQVEIVDTDGAPERFGDEPLLIAAEAKVPVFVGSSRLAAGRLAEERFAEQLGAHPGSGHIVHLLDDGLQHRQLARDLDIVLTNFDDLSDWLLPAGNLREASRALRRASVIAVPAEDDTAVTRLQEIGCGEAAGQVFWRFKRTMLPGQLKIGKADWKPSPGLKSTVKFVAFCGIARPGQFFDGLEAAGFSLSARHVFSDHHRFTQQDLDDLLRSARETSSDAFLTTTKDRVRLGSSCTQLEREAQLIAVGLTVAFEEESQIAAWLSNRLEGILRLSTNSLHGSVTYEGSSSHRQCIAGNY